jgi:hypothetical protein
MLAYVIAILVVSAVATFVLARIMGPVTSGNPNRRSAPPREAKSRTSGYEIILRLQGRYNSANRPFPT